MKRIYLHSLNNEKISAIEKICREQKIGISMLRDSDVNRSVADICGVKTENKRPPVKAPVIYSLPEILIFYGIDDKGLDDFLGAYNALRIETIRRKAVVTPTNLGWTLYELAEELGKESSRNKQ